MDDSDNDANLQTREDSIDEDDAFSLLPPGSIKPSESSKKRKRSCANEGKYIICMLPSYNVTIMQILLAAQEVPECFNIYLSSKCPSNTYEHYERKHYHCTQCDFIAHKKDRANKHPNAHKKEKELKEKKMKKTMSALKGKGVSNLLLRNNVCQIYLK